MSDDWDRNEPDDEVVDAELVDDDGDIGQPDDDGSDGGRDFDELDEGSDVIEPVGDDIHDAEVIELGPIGSTDHPEDADDTDDAVDVGHPDTDDGHTDDTDADAPTADEADATIGATATEHLAPAPANEDTEAPEVPFESLSFPRQSARTQRFTLGEPRTVEVSGDGQRIAFLRSRGPTDTVNCLWIVDAATGEERLLADPNELLGADDDLSLPPDELARRERMRESAGGITGYATDADFTLAAFTLAGRLFTSDLDTGESREVPVAGPVFDPRPDPLAQRIAYVSGSTLCVTTLDGTWQAIAGGDGDQAEPDTVSWGSPDHIAAEEIGRFRGYWWSPDGAEIAACRVDVAEVDTVHIGDPANPTSPAVEHRYPFAGTANPDVSLHLIDLVDGSRREVEWDRQALPYLTAVVWDSTGLLISVQSRPQRDVEIRTVDVATGATAVRWADTDAAWVELVAGTPRRWGNDRLVTCGDRDGARRLLLDGEPVTPETLQVRSVVGAGDDGIVFLANPVDDATVLHVWRFAPDGSLDALTDEPGIHTAAAGGGTIVIRTATLDERRTFWETLDAVELTSHAAEPSLALHASVHFVGPRRLATTLVLPGDHDGSPLPVLVDPYGGPHALRSVRAHNAHLSSQWFADQGFAVVVTDGAGTPGRGSEFEREIFRDLASAVLQDQVDALEQLAADTGVLDLERVAIRGWSFGGYLAALAVLLRPDRFHAAVAGAPVTEWRLYDTHYTERYLGDPATDALAYDGSSLLPLAKDLSRPLLLIHGLADDNVLAAHTLQLSGELLAHGRPHEVLPLVGVTHMTPQEVVAENLLLHQLDFVRRALDLDA